MQLVLTTVFTLLLFLLIYSMGFRAPLDSDRHFHSNKLSNSQMLKFGIPMDTSESLGERVQTVTYNVTLIPNLSDKANIDKGMKNTSVEETIEWSK